MTVREPMKPYKIMDVSPFFPHRTHRAPQSSKNRVIRETCPPLLRCSRWQAGPRQIILGNQQITPLSALSVFAVYPVKSLLHLFNRGSICFLSFNIQYSVVNFQPQCVPHYQPGKPNSIKESTPSADRRIVFFPFFPARLACARAMAGRRKG